MIDTNIILDDILNREPNVESARKISTLVTDERVYGYITANCLTDIFYIVSKNKSDAIARTIVKNLLLSYSVVSVDGDDCSRAIDFPMEDFEDALVIVCAEKTTIDYIITNDKDFLANIKSDVYSISPKDFLRKYNLLRNKVTNHPYP